MVTSDGQRFTFQVEVQLQAMEQTGTNTPPGGTAAANSSSNMVDSWGSATGTNPPAAATASPSAAPSATTPTTAGNDLGSAIQFPASLENFLSLLNQGRFNQPIQVNSAGSAAAGLDSATQAGVLKFSLLNQLPSTGSAG